MRILILLGFVIVAYSLTYNELYSCNQQCTSDEFTINCLFNPNNQGQSFPKNVECAIDVQKRNLCFGYYGCKWGHQIDDEVSFICWNCITNSPANNELYQTYKSCMQANCKSNNQSQE